MSEENNCGEKKCICGKKGKKCLLCRLVKALLWTLGGVVAFALLAVLTMPLWFNAVVGGAANALVPKLTETEFKLEYISFNPYNGHFLMKECHLSNPDGYSAKEAFGVSKVDVSIVLTDLFSNRLHFRNIEVRDTYVSYLDHLSVNNFTWILAKVAENLEKWGVKKEEKEEEKDKEPMKLIIERLSVSGTRVQIGSLPFALPVMPLELSGIGVKEDGVTFSQACDAVWQQIKGAFSSVGSGIGAAAGALTEGAAELGKGAQKAVEGVNKSLTEGASNAGKAVSDVTAGAGKAVTDGAGAAGKAVSDGAKAVGDGAKDLFKKAGGLFGN